MRRRHMLATLAAAVAAPWLTPLPSRASAHTATPAPGTELARVALDPLPDPDDGSLACLYACAQPGPFLRAQLTSGIGRGVLRANYNWLYSALNCDPNDNSAFLWDFVKLPNGQLALSPSQHYAGMTLYASLRPDWSNYVQLQAPRSADWIRATGGNEKFTALDTGILGFALKGFDGSYLAPAQAADSGSVSGGGSHSGYRLRGYMNQLVQDCVFQISNASVLQPNLDFMLGYQVTADDVRTVMDGYSITGLTDDEIQRLVAAMPTITPTVLDRAHQAGLHTAFRPDGSTPIVVGAVVLGIIGGVIGGLIAGPTGAVAGIGLGLASGANFGASLTVHLPHEDPTNTINPANSNIARTLIGITPSGGPYENQLYWQDVFKFTKFVQIGDPGLPDAACLYPPGAGNTVQMWFPTRGAVGPYIQDRDKYTPLQSATDGTYLTRHLFVVVQVKGDSRFQLRCHPDVALINVPERPNHSQLTQGSRILALTGDDSLHVHGAGEMWIGGSRIKGLTARSGHYFNHTSTYDSEVIATTLTALRALGYSTDNILVGDNFWNWVKGMPR